VSKFLENNNSLPGSFYLVSAASFLFEISRHITQPIFTLYILEMGASMIQVGVILSVQSILMMAMRIPLAIVSNRVGHYRMFLVAFFIQATAPILYAISPSPSWLYVIPLYQVVASGSFNQLTMSSVSNMAPATRQGDAIGRYMTFMSMGMFVGPLIAGGLVNQLGYRRLFMVASIFPVIGLMAFLKAKTKEMKLPSPKVKTVKDDLGTLVTLKAILRNRNVLILTFIRTSYAMSNTVFMSLYAVFAVQDLGFTPSLAALLFSVVGFSNAVIRFPAGRRADTFGPKKVLLIAFSTLIIVYISISYAKDIAPIFILLVLFGACWGTRAVTEWSTLTNSVTQETKTISISYLGSIWGVGATLGSFMVGGMGEVFPFSTIFLILALINLPALPAIYFMNET
jgi:MFS family permease